MYEITINEKESTNLKKGKGVWEGLKGGKRWEKQCNYILKNIKEVTQKQKTNRNQEWAGSQSFTNSTFKGDNLSSVGVNF